MLAFVREITLRPTTRSREIRLAPALLELFSDPEENVGRRPLPPLPLAQVLANVDALHAACNAPTSANCRRRTRSLTFTGTTWSQSGPTRRGTAATATARRIREG